MFSRSRALLLITILSIESQTLASAAGLREDVTGNQVIGICRLDQDDGTTCEMIYMAAAKAALEKSREFNPPAICPPSGVTMAQAGAIVKQFVTGNPQWSHVKVIPLAMSALYKAFPCSAGPT